MVTLPLHRIERTLGGNLAKLWHFVPELWRLTRRLRRERVEVVHCNSAWQIKPVIAGWLAGVPVVLHLNDAWEARFIDVLFPLLKPFCSGFIVTGERSRARYWRKGGGESAMAIQAPVDCARFDPARAGACPLPSHDGLTVMTSGNITPTKGVEYFIDMAADLERRDPSLRFVVVGPELANQTEYTAMLKQRVLDHGLRNLTFYGPTENMPSLLACADVFVCPSITESGPMVVWEAMAMARAIVSADVGDVSLYMPHGVAGTIVPVGDARALADGVWDLLQDGGKRAEFGRRARDAAVERLDISVAAARHAEAYRCVARRRPDA